MVLDSVSGIQVFLSVAVSQTLVGAPYVAVVPKQAINGYCGKMCQVLWVDRGPLAELGQRKKYCDAVLEQMVPGQVLEAVCVVR